MARRGRPPAVVPDAGAAILLNTHLAAVRDAGEGSRNDVLNRAAFCFGQLEGAGRIDTESVRANLWDACASYRADDGDSAARATIESGWVAGQEQPLPQGRASGPSPRGGGSANGTAPVLSEGGVQLGDTRLGVYSLDSLDTLGLEPLGDARRLLDGYAGRLLVVWGFGRDGAREATVYTLELSGLWLRDPARLQAWHCERARWWETEVTEATRERRWPEKHANAAGRYLTRAREPRGIESCLKVLPALVVHLAEQRRAP